MIDEREPGPLGDAVQDGLQSLLRSGDRKRQVCHHDSGAGAARDEIEHVAAGVVLVIGGEEFIARLEVQGAEHRVDGGRGVGDPGEVRGRCPEEIAERRARFVEQPLEIAHEELHRLALHA